MRTVQIYVNDIRLDLFQDEKIEVTSSIQNVKDISKGRYLVKGFKKILVKYLQTSRKVLLYQLLKLTMVYLVIIIITM